MASIDRLGIVVFSMVLVACRPLDPPPPSAGLGDLAPVLPGERLIDWRDVPLAGRSDPRARQNQAHLSRGTPAPGGVVLRYESEYGYRQEGRRGVGNMPHLRNLPAYQPPALAPESDASKAHPSEPPGWLWVSVFEDVGGALAELRSDSGSP